MNINENGDSIIYLDNCATTKAFPEVLDSFVKVNNNYWGNSASDHLFGFEARKLLTKARVQVADLLNVQEKEIIFTSGGTESNNMAINGIGLRYGKRGKHIITSPIEHPSVLKPIEQLRKRGYSVTTVPVNNKGQVSAGDVQKCLRADTILVSIMHVNNEIGSVQPIYEIGKLLRGCRNTFFHVDGVQGYGKVPLNLKNAGVDLYTLSGHKFHGLKGTGLLYIRRGIVLNPLILGGEHEQGFRSGTVNVAGVVALAKAMRICGQKYSEKITHLNNLNYLLYKELAKIEQIELNSTLNISAPHIVNFSLCTLNSEVFMRFLAEKGIIVSATRACATAANSVSSVIKCIGKSDHIARNAIRVSMCYDTTTTEINYTIKVIKENIQKLIEVIK